jgi:hypothetical protein
MTLIVPLRVNQDEKAALDEMAYSGEHGAENICDFLRLLLHREWNRRKGLPKPKPQEWQGAYRVAGKRKKSEPRKKQFRFKF